MGSSVRVRRERPLEQPLNLIFISLDTVRADRLSSYGYERPTTRHLDVLAETSVLFTDCVAQSTATAASHMSIFTGQYVHRHGLADNTRVRFPQATLASALRDHGWCTAAFTGHGSLQAKLGHDVDFELFHSESTDAGPTRASRITCPKSCLRLSNGSMTSHENRSFFSCPRL